MNADELRTHVDAIKINRKRPKDHPARFMKWWCDKMVRETPDAELMQTWARFVVEAEEIENDTTS